MRRLNFSILTSRVSPRRFAAALALLAAVTFAVVNAHIPFSLALDPFGLWRDTGPRRILTNERLSKYLLAQRYVPMNFDGVLIGPSFSANMDTRQITGSRLYNLSVNGANITELRQIFTPAARAQQGHLRYMVICLNPYIVANSGFKDETLRWSSPWEAALLAAPSRRATWRLLRGRVEPIFAESEAGWHNFDLYKTRQVTMFNAERLNAPASPSPDLRPIPIDPGALADLRALVAVAHGAGLQVFAFYFPTDRKSFDDLYQPVWSQFRATIETAFRPGDVVWDMNTPAYDHIRRNPEAYTDGHLSQVGTRLALEDVQRQLDARLKAHP
jgi:hypothetical protein